MTASSMRQRAEPADWGRRVDWSAVAIWSLCFALVVYLGLEGGGYDALVHDRVGIAVWWAVLALVLAGAMPRLRLSPLAWAALGLFAAFTVWTALSLVWTESTERTWADLARLAGFLGVFALALLGSGAGSGRRRRAAAAFSRGLAGAPAGPGWRRRPPHRRRGGCRRRRGHRRCSALAVAPGLVPGGDPDGGTPLHRRGTTLL